MHDSISIALSNACPLLPNRLHQANLECRVLGSGYASLLNHYYLVKVGYESPLNPR